MLRKNMRFSIFGVCDFIQYKMYSVVWLYICWVNYYTGPNVQVSWNDRWARKGIEVGASSRVKQAGSICVICCFIYWVRGGTIKKSLGAEHGVT
jgi:hypothetical protein